MEAFNQTFLPIEFENLSITFHGEFWRIGTFIGPFQRDFPIGPKRKGPIIPLGFVEDKVGSELRLTLLRPKGETVANYTKPSLIKTKFSFYLMINGFQSSVRRPS